MPQRFPAPLCCALFLGLDPTHLHRPLAGSFRKLNRWMPAHRDQDLPTSQPAYYMRSAVSANSENDGCCLFLNSETDGGDVAEVSTDPRDHTEAVICNFRPGQLLHWTDSREPPSGQMDSDFVRIIPFDNVWLGGMLNGGVMRGLRLAPLYPCVRHPIACCRCGANAPSAVIQLVMLRFG